MAQDNVTLEVEGMAHLRKQLGQFTERVQTNILRSAVHAGANTVRDAVRQQAPRSKRGLSNRSLASLRYGPLRKSIVSRRRKVRDGVIASHVVIARAFYGRFIHYGTRYIQTPNPFMRRGYEAAAPRVTGAIVSKLRQNIDKQIDKQRVSKR